VKKIIFLVLFFEMSLIGNAQIKDNKCGISVNCVYNNLLAGLAYFDMVIANNSNKKIDALEYKIICYNIYGDYLTEKKYNWHLNGGLSPGLTYSYREPTYVNTDDKIDKYSFKILRIHFTDETICDDYHDPVGDDLYFSPAFSSIIKSGLGVIRTKEPNIICHNNPNGDRLFFRKDGKFFLYEEKSKKILKGTWENDGESNFIINLENGHLIYSRVGK